MKPILVYCFIGLFALSCIITDHISPSPADPCELAQLAGGSGTNEFTYDATGGLSNWVITSVFDNGKTEITTYDFTRDATGRISSLTQTITYNGKTQSPAVAQFTYSNGLLTSTSTTTDPANPGSISPDVYVRQQRADEQTSRQ